MIGKAVFPGGNAQSLDNIAGQPIAEYVHTKSGTLHKLEGPPKAKNIVFKAAGDYNDGDTWTLNNTPVTVTYNGGEELLPTAVLVGDAVQAVVIGDKLRLMLQKPTPQESLVINWNYTNPVNQRGKAAYTTGKDLLYTLDMVQIRSAAVTLKQGYVNVNLLADKDYTPRVSGKIECILRSGKEYTAAFLLRGNTTVGTAVAVSDQTGLTVRGSVKNFLETNGFVLIYKTFTLESDVINPKIEIIADKTAQSDIDIAAWKLEPGKRFTGWPAWDYGAELLKCQRYFRSLAVHDLWGAAQNATNYIDFEIPGARGMRTKPAIINPSGFNLSKQGFTFEFVAFGLSPRLRATKTSHGIAAPYLEALDNIYLDANL